MNVVWFNNTFLSSHRMKDQIKSRMEILLRMELEERSLSQSTARQPTSLSSSTASKTGLTSSVTGRGSVASTTASVSTRRGGTREEVRADMLINTDMSCSVYTLQFLNREVSYSIVTKCAYSHTYICGVQLLPYIMLDQYHACS